MYQRILCPRCHSRFLSRIRRGKRRCKRCGYEFTPWLIKGVRLKDQKIKKIIEWFLLGQSGLWIAQRLKLGKNQVYQVLRTLREVMTRDVPEVFEGIVEVDETYLGGQKKNKNKKQLRKEVKLYGQSKRGWGTSKQPVFGILCRSGKVYAQLVENIEAKDLIPIIKKKVKSGTRVCSDTWRTYTGLATRGYVHRTVEHRKKEYTKGRNHINGLEGFWGYLKRKLASKGGVRRKHLHLFLGEYVWRYNFRQLSLEKQIKRLIYLLRRLNLSG